MINVTLTKYNDHTEVIVRVNGINQFCYTFDDYKQAQAFWTGFRCCQEVINGLVQSLPVTYEKRDYVNKPPGLTISKTAVY